MPEHETCPGSDKRRSCGDGTRNQEVPAWVINDPLRRAINRTIQQMNLPMRPIDRPSFHLRARREKKALK
ncbi:MAG TPA: hypothetical protein VFT51_02785 [Bacillales bacterium]|nr:hypothetical protein [Bacillales bacterium]